MDVQLSIIEEVFTLANWRAEGRADAEEWAALAAHSRKHAKERSKLQWKIADWLLRAKENDLSNDQLEAEVADIYKREMSITTIWDYLRVAERFRDHSRRRELLFFSHHKEVAIDEFDDVKQDRLLDIAEKRKLSVPKLRSMANTQKKRGQKLLNRTEGKKVAIRLSADTFKLLKKLAHARGYDGPHRKYDYLLQKIVTDHLTKFFQDKLILQEIEAWQAPIKKWQQERRDTVKQEKLHTETRLASSGDQLPTVEQYRTFQVRCARLVRDVLPKDATNLFLPYLRNVFGVPEFKAVGVLQWEETLRRLEAAQDDPQALVAILKEDSGKS